MTCRDVVAGIPAYLDNELNELDRATFDEHVTACSNCAGYLAQYRGTIAVGRRAFRDPLESSPLFVPDDLIGSILAARRL